MGEQIVTALSQSMHRAVVTLVNFLPGIAAFLVAVLIIGLLGVVIAMLVKRVLTALRFDERFSSSTASAWTPSTSPTLIVSRTIMWLCLFIGVLIGLTAFSEAFSSNTNVSYLLLPYFTHLIGATIILFFGSLAARFLARSVLVGAVNAQLQYARFLSLGIKWLVLVLASAMALDHIGVGGSIIDLAFGILFGGIVLTLSLAIGLGSRDLVTRSIEKTMEKPTNPSTGSVSPINESDASRPRLRHF
ncbi:hypothetical protein ACFQBQ_06435 [Granulicella cerasi]|uniref:Uncharacterized protein n=1 Tax=Granulicella cerasi TaxID=741063 RepID=A0ABW1Z9L9_9BACT|nr:hypothetical protein [Granulicella cerasi]